MALTIEEKVTELVQPLIESMGIELWGVRFRGGGNHAVLQIFIESDEGISADVCGDVTTMLSPAMDAADIISHRYTLEVSSPGLDRILFNLKQAAAYEGQIVKAELRIPVSGRHRLSGRLQSVSDDGILSIEDSTEGMMEVSFANTSQVRVVPEFKNNSKKVSHGASKSERI